MSVRTAAAVGVAVLSSAMALAAPASAQTAIRTDLAPGDLVKDFGVGAVVPPPGQFVWADATLPDGGMQSLGVLTQRDGTVLLSDVGNDLAVGPDVVAGPDVAAGTDAAAGLVAGTAPLDVEGAIDNATPSAGLAPVPTAEPECSDDAFNLKWWTFSNGKRKHPKWKSSFNWYFRTGSTPSNVGTSAAASALQRAVVNMTGMHNACGATDTVSATQSYLGSTTSGADISSNGEACLASDSKSVVTFGSIPSGALAVACAWGYDDGGTYARITKSDVRINKANYSWYADKPAVCSGRYSIEATMTHEFGHSFGIGHVNEADHGNLTMSTNSNGQCQNSEASLGLGDLRAMRTLY